MVNHKHYTYRVTWSEDDQEFVALCAEFPSVSFLSESHDKALTGTVYLFLTRNKKLLFSLFIICYSLALNG